METRGHGAARKQTRDRGHPSAVLRRLALGFLAHARGRPDLRLPHLHDRLRAALDPRLLPHADVPRPGLGARGVRALGRDPDAALRRRPAVFGRHRRPLRHRARDHCRDAALCRRHLHDGARLDAGNAVPLERRADRLRPVRLLVQSGDLVVRQAAAGKLAFARLRRRHRLGLVRPVPVLSARRGPDRYSGLADHARGLRRPPAADRPARLRDRHPALRCASADKCTQSAPG